jgi:hypothetical protein
MPLLFLTLITALLSVKPHYQGPIFMKSAGVWDMTPCNLMDGANISEEPAASSFSSKESYVG